MAPETPLSAKSKKSKDNSEKRSSKKRRHDEQSHAQDHPAEAVVDISSPSKPSKKRRKSEKTDDDDAVTKDVLPVALRAEAEADAALETSSSLLDEHTPFVQTTSSLLLPLAPQAYSYPIQGLCAEHLSPLLLTYYAPLDGIVLSYTSPRLSESPSPDPRYVPAPEDDPYASESDSAPSHPTRSSNQPSILARTTDEYNTPFIWLTADFTLLRPKRGSYVSGTVRVQNPSWLGLVCWNYFNAGIPRRRLPPSWTWVEADAEAQPQDDEAEDAQAGADGYWADENGQKVQGSITFRLRDFESAPTTERDRGFVSLEGTMLDEAEDKKADAEMREQEKGKTKDKGRHRAGRL
ncbi:hypothetical protein ANO11243_088010 [Dothideomycetidae sp. 11243]|nr:hypothetical protein ANO11243_088010 [fungal sp. No.11243]